MNILLKFCISSIISNMCKISYIEQLEITLTYPFNLIYYLNIIIYSDINSFFIWPRLIMKWVILYHSGIVNIFNIIRLKKKTNFISKYRIINMEEQCIWSENVSSTYFSCVNSSKKNCQCSSVRLEMFSGFFRNRASRNYETSLDQDQDSNCRNYETSLDQDQDQDSNCWSRATLTLRDQDKTKIKFRKSWSWSKINPYYWNFSYSAWRCIWSPLCLFCLIAPICIS